MSYYYAKNEEKIGPLSLDELKKIELKKDTLVWHEGLDDWVKAEEVKELRDFIKVSSSPSLNIEEESNIIPPAFEQSTLQQTENSNPINKEISHPVSKPRVIWKSVTGLGFFAYSFYHFMSYADVQNYRNISLYLSEVSTPGIIGSFFGWNFPYIIIGSYFFLFSFPESKRRKVIFWILTTLFVIFGLLVILVLLF